VNKRFFGKTPLCFEPKLNILQTPKNLCTTPKCLIETEYDPHRDEIQILGQFSSQKDIFDKIEDPLDFESKFDIFQSP
jgi:hypothetical protein